MKVQCDVCSRDEASVFCCADQAALCQACDLKVHRANKLARKHRRLSLSAQSQPVCDICQEKRGFVFCQQDRAILCHDCDVPIHSANELTMNHNRFLLTGVRLSSGPIPEAEELSSNISNNSDESLNKTNHVKSVVANETFVTTTANATAVSASSNENSSSISEYLIKMLPGYRVEDLLVDDAVTAAKDAFYKVSDRMLFMEADLDCGGGLGAVAEEFPIWVPHVPQSPHPKLFSIGGDVGSVSLHNYKLGVRVKEVKGTEQNSGVKMGRERWSDDSFMVPQINSGSNKRPRTSSTWDF